MPFKCDDCGRICQNRGGLISHMKTHKSKPKPSILKSVMMKSKGYDQMDDDNLDNTPDPWWVSDATQLNEFKKMGSKIVIQRYSNRGTMYLVIVQLKNEPRIVCKVGYSDNVQQRINALRQNYKADAIILICIKAIPNEAYEKAFHRSMEQQHPECKYLEIPGDTELYEYSDVIYNEFAAVKDHVDYVELEMAEFNKLKTNSNKWEKINAQMYALNTP